MDPETRESLIARLPDHADTAAWEEFVQLYEPLIYGIGRRHGLQPMTRPIWFKKSFWRSPSRSNDSSLTKGGDGFEVGFSVSQKSVAYQTALTTGRNSTDRRQRIAEAFHGVGISTLTRSRI